jgi:hypothetical protein
MPRKELEIIFDRWEKPHIKCSNLDCIFNKTIYSLNDPEYEIMVCNYASAMNNTKLDFDQTRSFNCHYDLYQLEKFFINNPIEDLGGEICQSH